jgi:quercetin dioxygenase-like cupin family protein
MKIRLHNQKVLSRVALLLILQVYSFSIDAQAQHFPANLFQLEHPVHSNQVKTLGNDSLSSGFFISIPDKVDSHYHKDHSEHVYIIDGNGIMNLGADTFSVAAGDYIFIPRNTIHGLRVKSLQPVKVLSIQSPFFDGRDRIPIR